MAKRAANESDSDTESSRSDQETDSEEEKIVKKERAKKSKTPAQKEKDKKEATKTVNQTKKRKAGSKAEPTLFDELKVDIDMSCDKVSSKRVKLAANLLIENKIVDVKEENGKKYSYPALVFSRKTKDGKIFEFNVPTILARKLCEAVKTLTLE